MEDALLVAVRVREDGGNPEAAADALVSRGHGPIDSIKAIREAFGMRVGEAKELVHHRLPADQRVAAERLWDAAEVALRSDE